MVNRAR